MTQTFQTTFNQTLVVLYISHSSSFFVTNGLDEPLHAVGKTFFGDGGAGLDVPCPTFLNVFELKGGHDLWSFACHVQILLVSVDEEGNALEIVLGEKRLELVVALAESDVIRRVDDVDEAVGVFIIVLPVGSDLSLTTDVPHVQLEAVLLLQPQDNVRQF